MGDGRAAAGAAARCCLLLFSYLFLWTVNPGEWPPQGVSLRDHLPTAGAAGLYLASSMVMLFAGRVLSSSGAGGIWGPRLAIPLAAVLMLGGVALDAHGYVQTGLRPDAHSYGAQHIHDRFRSGLLRRGAGIDGPFHRSPDLLQASSTPFAAPLSTTPPSSGTTRPCRGSSASGSCTFSRGSWDEATRGAEFSAECS